MRFEAVLLDLDGTLIDTLPDIADATNAMLADLGHGPLNQTVVGTLIGKGTENLVQRVLNELIDATHAATPEQVQHALGRFIHHYQRLNGVHSRVYPGTVEGLDAFAQAGVPMAVVTNKMYDFAVPLLERTGLLPYFRFVVGGDTCARKKPDPLPFLHACEKLNVRPQKALAIGDSVNDAVAARTAGMAVLAVPYGYNEGHSVHDLNVNAIVASIEQAAHWAHLGG
jgi:phosphoglycolate phosphatase